MILNAEVMSVAPDEVVVTFTSEPGVDVVTLIGEHEVATSGPHHVARVTGLESATEYPVTIEGLPVPEDMPYLPATITTLEVPPGALLCTVTTANDVHFGEVECGKLEGWGEEIVGPVFSAAPGDAPYPEVMNRTAVAEMAGLDPTAVVVKGDLTSFGTEPEYEAFLAAYGALGDRMHHVRGNHDAMHTDAIADTGPFSVTVPGAILAVLDTVRPRHHTGRVSADQMEWLDARCAEADRPVLVFGHHNIWNLHSDSRNPEYFGINPDDSEGLIEVAARRESFAGYFAGHTHRNRVRRFAEARDVPFVEVACVKDYPGAWAEYRIYEGGYVQVHRRIGGLLEDPAALDWTEKTRQMFHGLYRDYALGPLHWRCFTQSF